MASQTRSRIVKEVKIVNLASESKHRLKVIGLLPLTVTIGGKATRTTFVFVNKLRADVILGCQYIDTAVDEINVKKRAQILKIERQYQYKGTALASQALHRYMKGSKSNIE